MSDSFRKSLALGVVLLVSPAGFARTRSIRGGETGLEITVRVYNYAQVPPNDLARAESEAGSILRRAGVETVWLDCPLSVAELERYPACNQPAGQTHLSLKIVPRSMAQRYGLSSTTMGFALLSSNGNGGSESFVFYGWVERLAELQYAPRHAILAHMMAHEIGHLLLNTNSHFPVGIVRAEWAQEDLQRASREGLQFTAQQAELIRKQVWARTNRQRAPEIAGPASVR